MSSSPSSPSSSCPVVHQQESQQNQNSVSSCSSCPVQHHSSQPDAFPSDGQTKLLPNVGTKSTIPRLDNQNDEEVFVYPSPQRFYNAMKRKGWAPNEQDMNLAVAIHNTVNERCWQQVLEYEKLHYKTCSQPKLFSFQGKPNQLTPKAQFKSLVGYGKPFDRHDWIVDRCGTKIRYVIDFYEGQPSNDPEKPISIFVDVRPELSFGGLWDRLNLKVQKSLFSESTSRK